MKFIALATLFVAPVSQAATTYMIDINTAADPITAPGWTGLDAVYNGNGGSVVVDGVNFSIGSADGSRIRGGSGSPNPDALFADFVFDDGASQAVIVFFGGAGDISAGTWQVDIYSFDGGSGTIGPQILGLRTNGTEFNPAVINGSPQADGRVTDNLAITSSGPAESFTFLSDGVSSYDVFLRENNTQNRTRFNAVRLTFIPEPSSAFLFGIGGVLLLMRRKKS